MVWWFNDLVVERQDAEAGTLHANCREMKIDFLQAVTQKASTSISGAIRGEKPDKGEATLYAHM